MQEKVFRILHMSDFQVGSHHCWWAPRASDASPPIYSRTFHVDLGGFLEKFKKEDTPKSEKFWINLILVTGDIAEHGKPDEYAAAHAFIQELKQAIPNDDKVQAAVMLIPGNHDLDWEDDKAAVTKSDKERFEAKFGAFNHFAKCYNPREINYEDPYVVLSYPQVNPWIQVVGFNSCMNEGFQPEQHYGFFGRTQLQKLPMTRNDSNLFRIAAFHHNPLLLPLPARQSIEALFKAMADTPNQFHARNLRNFLHDSEDVFRELIKRNFVMGLHGHQHFDGTTSIQFPGEDGMPPDSSGITLLGAGSIGLSQASEDQLSVASAQLITIRDICGTWEIEIRRINIIVTGRYNPSVQFKVDRPREMVLPNNRIGGLINAFRRMNRYLP